MALRINDTGSIAFWRLTALTDRVSDDLSEIFDSPIRMRSLKVRDLFESFFDGGRVLDARELGVKTFP
jgi:hypothetical protein